MSDNEKLAKCINIVYPNIKVVISEKDDDCLGDYIKYTISSTNNYKYKYYPTTLGGFSIYNHYDCGTKRIHNYYIIDKDNYLYDQKTIGLSDKDYKNREIQLNNDLNDCNTAIEILLDKLTMPGKCRHLDINYTIASVNLLTTIFINNDAFEFLPLFNFEKIGEFKNRNYEIGNKDKPKRAVYMRHANCNKRGVRWETKWEDFIDKYLSIKKNKPVEETPKASKKASPYDIELKNRLSAINIQIINETQNNLSVSDTDTHPHPIDDSIFN